MQCRAVPCRAMHFALLCGAVPCCAALVLCFLSNLKYQMSRKVVSGTGMYVYRLLVFLVSSFDCPLSAVFMLFFRKLHPHCRSERGIANKHTAQHGLISLTQVALGVINRLLHQIMGPFFPPSSHLVVYFLARGSRTASATAERCPC